MRKWWSLLLLNMHALAKLMTPFACGKCRATASRSTCNVAWNMVLHVARLLQGAFPHIAPCSIADTTGSLQGWPGKFLHSIDTAPPLRRADSNYTLRHVRSILRQHLLICCGNLSAQAVRVRLLVQVVELADLH